jgi:hypothetical protein
MNSMRGYHHGPFKVSEETKKGHREMPMRIVGLNKIRTAYFQK